MCVRVSRIGAMEPKCWYTLVHLIQCRSEGVFGLINLGTELGTLGTLQVRGTKSVTGDDWVESVVLIVAHMEDRGRIGL